MSNFTIEDGGITGSKARVTREGRLKADTISRAEASQAAELGKSFNVNTGTVTLTSATVSSILYLKNTIWLQYLLTWIRMAQLSISKKDFQNV